MRGNTELATVSRFTSGTSFVEAYGLLTAGLLLGNGAEPSARVICFTAARPGDGTSTTSLNLALTMAGTGRKTLLVDSNFRAPMLHKLFDAPQSPGLAEILMKETTLHDTIRATRTQHLSFLPAGNLSRSPQGVLQSGIMRSVFEELKGTYEFVIIDTPSALRFPDALHVARAADGAIVVVPAGRAPRGATMEVRRRLERVGVKIFGIVLNRIDPKEVAAF
jgi:capsular exopolysaccharide synthesis family protein